MIIGLKLNEETAFYYEPPISFIHQLIPYQTKHKSSKRFSNTYTNRRQKDS